MMLHARRAPSSRPSIPRRLAAPDSHLHQRLQQGDAQGRALARVSACRKTKQGNSTGVIAHGASYDQGPFASLCDLTHA